MLPLFLVSSVRHQYCQLNKTLLTGYGPRFLSLKLDSTMATSTDEKWAINKLDGANWSTWKIQMKHLLLAKGLWGVVNESETLAEDANEAARTEHRKKSQKAFSLQ